MGRARAKRALRASCVLVAFAGVCGWAQHAAADRLGESNLPQSKPSLKGRISEDAATVAIVFGTGVGATNNAGPTLLERPSGFLDNSIGYAQIIKTALGRVDVSVNLNNRRYMRFSEADELSGAAAATLTHDWGSAQSSAALTVTSGSDVEERLTESSLVVEHALTKGDVKPYVRAETALLQYRDLPGPAGPFQNQDDRDRLSSRVLTGLRLTLTDHLTFETGAGVDIKTYLDRTDDFGVDRDSITLFPLIGLAYADERASFRAVYTPFLRLYREPLFDDAWKHGYQIEGEAKLSDEWKVFGAARYGFEETDFLIASSAYERVMLAGTTLTLPQGALTFAASRSWRTYDGLGLLAIDRADDKTEFAIAGEMALDQTLSLNARISYLGYESSFGFVGTDALTAMVGLSYAVTR
jgi:hypothetical protein